MKGFHKNSRRIKNEVFILYMPDNELLTASNPLERGKGSRLMGTHSEAASYEFTTLTCIPGIIHYNDTKIQLLDLPGIIEGARGVVIAVSKSSDIVLMVLDASKVSVRHCS
ncbi:hypothetical protein RND71_026716 [Anisodus tanguticus]|uniref:G domain-containing protein n=1 Tax=Anisodus tanguticus TaxID=243964 RepID=A0AAE1RNV3_9SOLA|nr:hypothetical protein RND71_026716 [Anisodus tanguticus]